MTTFDPMLLDTNVLVYAADTTSPYHSASHRVRDQGIGGILTLCVTPQVLSEFFAVVSDSRRVQNPRSPEEAIAEVEKYYRANALRKIYPGEDFLERIISLVKLYRVSRQQIFDLQLVATMVSNGVTHLCTYNTRHFAGYSEIQTLTPEDLCLEPQEAENESHERTRAELPPRAEETGSPGNER